jgi:aryl carrier-like protein
MEKTFAALWAELLKIEKVSVRDNFFALGGDSLLAARMSVEIFRRSGHRVSLRSVVAETLEQLAAGCS